MPVSDKNGKIPAFNNITISVSCSIYAKTALVLRHYNVQLKGIKT